MKLETAKVINKVSKLFICAALAGLVFFFAAYFMGRIEFKYFSLPVMACFIGVSWLIASRLAITSMEEDDEKERS
jgi:hypothetical protein